MENLTVEQAILVEQLVQERLRAAGLTAEIEDARDAQEAGEAEVDAEGQAEVDAEGQASGAANAATANQSQGQGQSGPNRPGVCRAD